MLAKSQGVSLYIQVSPVSVYVSVCVPVCVYICTFPYTQAFELLAATEVEKNIQY